MMDDDGCDSMREIVLQRANVLRWVLEINLDSTEYREKKGGCSRYCMSASGLFI